ncbi:uncharacterized protein LOC135092778 isoform X2 [Scylla paramamosain]|uniref:uncharacterized protein LOC135092778 isoform X2 n=1 Tax=Scylla paramamosain TaxID=85552 RepID=UPI0030829088
MDEDLRPHSLLLEDLLSLTQPARNLLQAGLVFAVHHMNGQSRHARFSLQDDHLFLHSLQDEVPPPGAVTVTMQEVVPDAFPYEVFLDLAWPGTSPRRVVVRLSRDTPRGRQFLLLCTGQRGSCYANTRLLKSNGLAPCTTLLQLFLSLASSSVPPILCSSPTIPSLSAVFPKLSELPLARRVQHGTRVLTFCEKVWEPLT